MTAPTISKQIWDISKFLLSHLNKTVSSSVSARRRQQSITANLSCQLALTEYGQQLGKSASGHRLSSDFHQIDIMMDDNIEPIGNELVPLTRVNSSANVLGGGFGSGGGSVGGASIPAIAPQPSTDNDTFENILQVTSNQEAVYAYYYMDENNKVTFKNNMMEFTRLLIN